MWLILISLQLSISRNVTQRVGLPRAVNRCNTSRTNYRIPEFTDMYSFFLRFKLQDDKMGKDDLAAWTCIRLDRLQSGYRFLHLLDAKGTECPGVLLIRVTKSLS